ncbi:MAG: ISAs1 family transposase [Treponema sp.]|jgi:predicted transposase YbfD/YdcC|nr:ISAs1 family transposase [Treponema sp.]
MGEITRIKEYFSGVETTKEHNGYFFSVGEALTVVILGTLCGLKNVSQISQWSEEESVRGLLAKHLGIERIPCYYWLLCLLKLIDMKSLNQCLMRWAQSLIPDGKRSMTISFDGKTIRSTGKMSKNQSPLHIVSAHLAEQGITLAGRKADDKSNEIPAVRDLTGLLEAEGCMIVADAMHCQKETASIVVEKKVDYLFNAKDNQSAAKKDIADYVQDDCLRKTMDTFRTFEKNGGRLEERTGFATHDIDWFYGKGEWKNLSCIGAIHRRFTYKGKTSDEWHYYISSRELTAEELLRHARLEWSVESMHWLLDAHFSEDYCRIEDETVQQVLNAVRKIALNCVKTHKQKTNSKFPLSRIMLGCLLDCRKLIPVLLSCEN